MKKREKQKPEDADNNYIDNKEFLAEMVEWKKMCKEAEDQGDPRPPMTDSIGEKIMMIAEGLARKKNFSGYTYKDEMILDGIENCVRYGHNFDPEKSPNPFAYFSTMIYYAFLRRIQTEKKESMKKKKCIELAIDDPRYLHDLGNSGTSAAALVDMQKKLSAECEEYEESISRSKKKKKKKNKSSSSSSSGEDKLFE